MTAHELPTPGLLSSMWRFRWTSLAITLVVTLASLAAGLLLRPEPTATATVTLKNPGADSLLARGVVGDASLTRYTRQRADFVLSDEVLTAVADALPGYSITTLRGEVKVDASQNSNQLTVTASGENARKAVRLANQVVDSYRAATQRQVQRLTDSALSSIATTRRELLDRKSPPSATLAELARQESALQTDTAIFRDGVDFVQEATVEEAAAPGLPYRYVAVGFIFGAAFAALVAWVRADRRRRVDREEDVEQVLGAPLLASVEVARKHESATEVLPAYRMLSATLGERSRHGLLMVIAPTDGVDRSEVSYNLAVALATDARRILVVDADLDAPLSTWLWNGTPGWLRAAQAGSKDRGKRGDRVEVHRPIARHGTLRAGGGGAGERPEPPTVADRADVLPGGAAAGVGLVAQVAREGHPEAKPLALPTLALQTLDEPARNGAANGSAPNGAAANGSGPQPPAGANGAAANGTAANGTGANGAGPNGTANANGKNGSAKNGRPNGADGGANGTSAANAAADPDDGLVAHAFGTMQRVHLREDAELDLVTVRQWKGRDSAEPIRRFIDDLETAAARYDLVLVDLPAPDSSPLAPALLRASTEVLAVVPQGAGERELEQVRRASVLFSTPLAGYVFTRLRK